MVLSTGSYTLMHASPVSLEVEKCQRGDLVGPASCTTLSSLHPFGLRPSFRAPFTILGSLRHFGPLPPLWTPFQLTMSLARINHVYTDGLIDTSDVRLHPLEYLDRLFRPLVGILPFQKGDIPTGRSARTGSSTSWTLKSGLSRSTSHTF